MTSDRINDEPQPERRQALNEPAPSGGDGGGRSNGVPGCLLALLLPLITVARRLKPVRPA